MRKYKIAVIPGDGIGKEVVPDGIRVLEAAGTKFGIQFQWDEFPWGCEYYAKTGRMMPEDGLDQIRYHAAIFLGAVGIPGIESPLRGHEAGDIETVLREGPRTRDIGGEASTQELGKAIAKTL